MCEGRGVVRKLVLVIAFALALTREAAAQDAADLVPFDAASGKAALEQSGDDAIRSSLRSADEAPDVTASIDVAGDERPEVVTITAGAVRIREPDGRERFEPRAFRPRLRAALHRPTNTRAPFRVASGDVDGDSRADLVVIDDIGIRVRLRRGDGLAPATVHPADASGSAVLVKDLDADGRVEIVGRHFAFRSNGAGPRSRLVADGTLRVLREYGDAYVPVSCRGGVDSCGAVVSLLEGPKVLQRRSVVVPPGTSTRISFAVLPADEPSAVEVAGAPGAPGASTLPAIPRAGDASDRRLACTGVQGWVAARGRRTWVLEGRNANGLETCDLVSGRRTPGGGRDQTKFGRGYSKAETFERWSVVSFEECFIQEDVCELSMRVFDAPTGRLIRDRLSYVEVPDLAVGRDGALAWLECVGFSKPCGTIRVLRADQTGRTQVLQVASGIRSDSLEVSLDGRRFTWRRNGELRVARARRQDDAVTIKAPRFVS